MKIALIIQFFMLLVTVPAIAQNTPAEKVVMQLSQQKNTLLINQQYDSLKAILDTRCTYIHSNGWEQNATEVITDMQSGKLRYTKAEIKSIKARQYEKMVVVNAVADFGGIMEEQPFNIPLVITEVYINRASGWKLISRHASRRAE